jgi:acylphosphatase
MIQHEIKVTGKVQGVGFRFFAEHHAKLLNIKGWVKNTRDGGVLAVAQGDSENMKLFLKKLKVGPPLSNVDRLDVFETDILDKFNDFEIRY